MRTFNWGDQLPDGARDYKHVKTVKMVQMEEDFEIDYLPGCPIEGKAGDYLGKNAVVGFFKMPAEYFKANYEPV